MWQSHEIELQLLEICGYDILVLLEGIAIEFTKIEIILNITTSHFIAKTWGYTFVISKEF